MGINQPYTCLGPHFAFLFCLCVAWVFCLQLWRSHFVPSVLGAFLESCSLLMHTLTPHALLRLIMFC
jgi:hypothetical protein